MALEFWQLMVTCQWSCISPVFNSGSHRGVPIETLVTDLQTGRIRDDDPRMNLNVVCCKGHYVSLNNILLSVKANFPLRLASKGTRAFPRGACKIRLSFQRLKGSPDARE